MPSEADWKRLATAGGLDKLAEKHRETLAVAMRDYLDYMQFYGQNAVPPADVKKALRKLSDAFEAVAAKLAVAIDVLESAINSGSPKDNAALRTIRERAAAKFRRYVSEDRLRALLAEMQMLAEASDDGIEALRIEPGNPGDHYLNGLLCVAADVFKTAGGDGHVSAHCLNFVREIQKLVGNHQTLEDEALRKRITRARKKLVILDSGGAGHAKEP